MDYQNVTLSIPKEVLRRAKHLAIERGTSLSGLLTQLLTDLTAKEAEYRRARERHLAMLEGFKHGHKGMHNRGQGGTPCPVKTAGCSSWTPIAMPVKVQGVLLARATGSG